MPSTSRTKSDVPADLPGEPSGFRHRMRSKPGLGHAWRFGVFLAGLLFIAACFALAVLPGPLTIPPVLFGLWIWSTEFRWAHRLFQKFREKGDKAWEHAKLHPVSSTIFTVLGLVAAGAAIWATSHYHLVDRGKDLVGLG
jgi:hypothetical protein